MKRAVIKVLGQEYPCYQTGGGLLRFHEATGKEVQDLDMNDIGDLSEALYSFTKSACRRERQEFPYESAQDFMDDVLPEDITAWARSMMEDPEADAEEKKSPSA